jgi:hypothetical protein
MTECGIAPDGLGKTEVPGPEPAKAASNSVLPQRRPAMDPEAARWLGVHADARLGKMRLF